MAGRPPAGRARRANVNTKLSFQNSNAYRPEYYELRITTQYPLRFNLYVGIEEAGEINVYWTRCNR